MAINWFKTTSPTTEDNLITDNLYPAVRGAVLLQAGEVYKRGDALGRITATKLYVLADSTASDGSEEIFAVLADDCDATLGDTQGAAYLSGQFNPREMRFAAGSTAADFDAYDGMRGSIWLKEQHESPQYGESTATTDEGIVAGDKAWLRVSFAPGDNLNSVTQNVTLQVLGIYGSTIAWASSNAAVITAAGVVTRGVVDETVTLTATITYSGVTDTKAFSVRVLAA